jgi:hypothetical protein
MSSDFLFSAYLRISGMKIRYLIAENDGMYTPKSKALPAV